MRERSVNRDEGFAWLRRLPRGDSIRRAMERVLVGGAVEPGDVAEALRRLERPHRRRWQDVALCACLLGRADALTPDDRDLALSALRRIAARRAHRGPGRAFVRGILWGVTIASCLVGTMYAVALLWPPLLGAPGDWDRPIPAGLLLAQVVLFLGAASSLSTPPLAPLLDRWAGERCRAVAIAALGRLRDVDSLASIASAACEPLETVGRMASAALGDVAQSVTPEHYGALPPGAVPWLCRVLAQSYRLGREGDTLSLGLLDALEAAGDGRAVGVVQQLAQRSAWPMVTQRAAEVLPVLQARQARERDAARLLRPAEAPATDVLLRPAQPTPEVPAEQLLRPVTGEATPDH